MMKLEDLPEKERINILIQCDQFFLTYNKLKSAGKVFHLLCEELNINKTHHKELWMIITLVGKSLRSGCSGSQIPMKDQSYTTANKVHELGSTKDTP